MELYDLIIIGAGPSGINCGISARKKGLRFLLLEKGVLVDSLFHFPTNMTFFSTSQNLEIGDVPFISHGEKPTRREALEYYRRVAEAFELPIHLYEPVYGLHPGESGGYTVQTSKGLHATKTVVVATGYYGTPRLLGVPGEDLPKVKHYYDEAHSYIGQKVLVVGTANSACDVALETYYKSAEVTMAIREREIYEKVKYWIRPNIENRIREGSIRAYFQTTLCAITPDRVQLQTPEGRIWIDNDFVLAMTGYQPDYSFLKNLGLPIEPGPVQVPAHDPETLETPLPGVYLAGVVCGGLDTSTLFIENTRHHGDLIISHIQSK
ncbi:MAG: YpdA family putative bacillithiol disulfide reductase [Saprospirales bacterium]|nr:YpdA family putative bacillithiol disulfide reductase [Saprospirales bacterium]